MTEQSNNQILVTIHNSLMTLIGDVGAVKQSIEHMANSHDNLRNVVSKLDDRVDTIEKQRIADKSSWRGPKTLIMALSAMVALAAAVVVLLDKI